MSAERTDEILTGSLSAVDDDTVDILNEDGHSLAVTFFFDDGAMDHSDECYNHAFEWRCVVRLPARYGYAERSFTVSPSLVEALEAVTTMAARS